MLEAPFARTPARRLHERRAWLICGGLLLSAGLGLPLGWGLASLYRRRKVHQAWRWAIAGVGAALWLLVAHNFYAAARTLFAADPPSAEMTWWLAAGWAASAAALAPLIPWAQRLYRRPWDQAAIREAPALRPATRIPDGVDLGTDETGRTAALDDAEANTHVLILGATGSGKTNALLLILASALARGLPLVVIDGKGSAEFRRQLETLARAAGRELAVWSFAGPGHYDPLARGEATELRDKLMAVETWTEPHYRRAAERYLGTVLDVLATLGRPVTLGAVADLLFPAALEGLGRQLPPAKAQRLYTYLDALDASSKSAVFGLGNRLAVLVESRAGAWLHVPDGEAGIDLLDAVRKAQPVLFSLDSLRFPNLAAQLGALLFQDLRTVAGELLADREHRCSYLAVDEFSAFSGPQVLALLNRGREAGLCCVLATQDLADVAAAGGPALVDQVLANTGVKLLLRQDVDASASRLAAGVGTRETWLTTYRSHAGWPTGEASLRPAEEFVLHPSLLKQLPPHQAVLVKKTPRLSVQRLRLRPLAVQPGAGARATPSTPGSPARFRAEE